MGGAFVIDPVSALYPAVVAASDAAVRQAIEPLIQIASDCRSCILLVRHLNKSGGRRSLYRGGGSIGIVGACRTGLLAGVHPDDPNRRVLSMTKCNIAQPGSSLTYRVETVPARPAAIRYMVGERHPETGAELIEPLDLERAIPSRPNHRLGRPHDDHGRRHRFHQTRHGVRELRVPWNGFGRCWPMDRCQQRRSSRRLSQRGSVIGRYSLPRVV